MVLFNVEAMHKDHEEDFLTLLKIARSPQDLHIILSNIKFEESFSWKFALYGATRYGYFGDVTRLVQENPNDMHALRIAFEIACDYQHHEIVETLIKYIDINAIDENGNTLLHDCIEHKNVKAVARILEQPAIKVNAINNQMKCPLVIAIEKDSEEIVSLLLKHKDINPNGVQDNTLALPPLHAAINRRNVSIVQQLIMRSDIDKNMAWGHRIPFEMALYLYIHNNNEQSNKKLLSMIRLFLRFGVMPMKLGTADDGHDYMVKILAEAFSQEFLMILSGSNIDSQFNINTQDQDGGTLLMYFAGRGNIPMVQKLLEMGANPFLADNFGNTALTIARVIKDNPFVPMDKEDDTFEEEFSEDDEDGQDTEEGFVENEEESQENMPTEEGIAREEESIKSEQQETEEVSYIEQCKKVYSLLSDASVFLLLHPSVHSPENGKEEEDDAPAPKKRKIENPLPNEILAEIVHQIK